VLTRAPECKVCFCDGVAKRVTRGVLRDPFLLQHGDRVLCAVTGGPSSTALLNALTQVRSTLLPRRERGRVTFDLAAVHVDESAALGEPEVDEARVRSVVASASAATDPGRASLGGKQLRELQRGRGGGGAAAAEAPAPGGGAGGGSGGGAPASPWDGTGECAHGVRVWWVDLAWVMSERAGVAPSAVDAGPLAGADELRGARAGAFAGRAPQECRDRLARVLGAVQDPSQREDVAAHLRHALLLAVAGAWRCNKLAVGDSATRMAVRTVERSSKGRGEGLPGELQAVDARASRAWGGATVVRPCREVLARDLAAYAHLMGLGGAGGPTLASAMSARSEEAGAVLKGTIGALCERFLETMQAEGGTTTHTVLNSASRLRAFGFNRPGAMAPPPVRSPVDMRLPLGERSPGPEAAVVLCRLCLSPGAVGAPEMCLACREVADGAAGGAGAFCALLEGTFAWAPAADA